MALTRPQEQKKLRAIRRTVEEIRWLLEPLSAENIGAPDPEEYPAPFRISHIIGELSVVENGLRDAIRDLDHWFNILVSDPKTWTHPWHGESGDLGVPSLREATGLSTTMLEKKLSLIFVCKNCGASPASLELPDDHTDDDIAICKSCRFRFGTFGDIKAETASHARREYFSKSMNLTFNVDA